MKTKLTHTPGPWSALSVKLPRPRALVYRDKYGTPVAGCFGPRAEANALLIAAAPELLAALRTLLACPAMNEDSAEPETVKAYGLAMDAIAKATRRAQP